MLEGGLAAFVWFVVVGLSVYGLIRVYQDSRAY
jgi:hypothetical protein